MIVQLKKLFDAAVTPQRATDLASGFDLHAFDVVPPENVLDPTRETFRHYILNPGERVLVRTGIAVGLPVGMEAQVRPRSGLALRDGVTVLNTPGTVDADYTGDVGVILINHGTKPFHIFRGDRIAQLVFAPVHHDIQFKETTALTATERGSGGYGHTGKGEIR
ncbi:deoxyuridine 5'-triphosphate nucleotidohydrolase [Paenibacillus jamilae]|uniref:Deoxyuridine 5'-triphosphate nucleotidohydrolase n=1 Tax=Paenibacillus jamilae TaxID=114136 RepID=A0ACC5A0R7_9BACL|nr:MULTISPECIES: dUTP diphosphatase [Bacteria]KTQ67313.1 deoxyuridine 5'-triphosphate nucleotidohydrolase [Enterobacter cancerogenus]KTS84443.1 deoxyuridine 5'-triphosphate nucleotidohydrolase [Paenibacillus jamilae]